MGIFDQDVDQNAEQDIEQIFAEEDKVHLFQTHQQKANSSKNYIKVLLIVAAFVLAGGGVIYYLMLPGIGDPVLGPAGLEDDMRAYFLDKQKRTADDITFYKCDNFYWARVNVETRTDLPDNPVFKVSRYRAKAVRRDDGTWDISGSPITDPDMDVPCSF